MCAKEWLSQPPLSLLVGAFATRAVVNAQISAANTGDFAVKRRRVVTTGGCKSRQNGTTKKECSEVGCT